MKKFFVSCLLSMFCATLVGCTPEQLSLSQKIETASTNWDTSAVDLVLSAKIHEATHSEDFLITTNDLGSRSQETSISWLTTTPSSTSIPDRSIYIKDGQLYSGHTILEFLLELQGLYLPTDSTYTTNSLINITDASPYLTNIHAYLQNPSHMEALFTLLKQLTLDMNIDLPIVHSEDVYTLHFDTLSIIDFLKVLIAQSSEQLVLINDSIDLVEVLSFLFGEDSNHSAMRNFLNNIGLSQEEISTVFTEGFTPSQLLILQNYIATHQVSWQQSLDMIILFDILDIEGSLSILFDSPSLISEQNSLDTVLKTSTIESLSINTLTD